MHNLAGSKMACLLVLLLLVSANVKAQTGSEPPPDLRVRKVVAPPYDDRLYFTLNQGRVRIEAKVLQSGQIESATVEESFWSWNRSMDEFFLTFAGNWLFEPSDAPRTIEIFFDFKLLPESAPDRELGTVFIAPSTVEIRRREPPPVSFHRFRDADQDIR